MFKLRFKVILALLLIDGVLIEIHASYNDAVGRSNVVMPGAKILRLPQAAHRFPVSELPMIQQFDGMVMTTGSIVFSEN